MSVSVLIPTPMRTLTDGAETVSADGATVTALIDNLQTQFPGMKEKLCDDDGRIRRFVNVYINGEDARFLDGPQTALKDGDEVSFVPAVAGGRA